MISASGSAYALKGAPGSPYTRKMLALLRYRRMPYRLLNRAAVVGSNPVTGLLIEASYRRTLDTLDAHLRAQPFLMGARPGASDFAFYGQLTQLAQFDPTPAALTLARPRARSRTAVKTWFAPSTPHEEPAWP